MLRTHPEPLLSVIVIGLNEAARLRAALTAVVSGKPNGFALEVFYVDSGSRDDSVQIARSVPGVQVLHLQNVRPSAAKARNLGLRNARGDFVQLVDGDSVLQAGWMETGLRRLQQSADIACVFGHCTEMFPTQSVYMHVCSLDWHIAPGDHRLCGGNAMWRRDVLAANSWFDETLRYGEEPDLCARVRHSGYRIVCIDHPMVTHDLGMTRFRQYWRRGEATGMAYARVAARHWRLPERLWLRECVRNFLEPALWCAVAALGWWLGRAPGAAGLLLAWWTLRAMQIGLAVRARASGWAHALLYGLHCQLIRLPVAAGQLKGLLGRW